MCLQEVASLGLRAGVRMQCSSSFFPSPTMNRVHGTHDRAIVCMPLCSYMYRSQLLLYMVHPLVFLSMVRSRVFSYMALPLVFLYIVLSLGILDIVLSLGFLCMMSSVVFLYNWYGALPRNLMFLYSYVWCSLLGSYIWCSLVFLYNWYGALPWILICGALSCVLI